MDGVLLSLLSEVEAVAEQGRDSVFEASWGRTGVRTDEYADEYAKAEWCERLSE